MDEEPEFASLYHAIRAKENRILTDEQVAKLPDGRGLWNATEWRIRAASADRLVWALNKQGKELRILEVGCGNGWLANYMKDRGHVVLGIDPFTSELEQAARVFSNGPTFARIDLFNPLLPSTYFDAVVFAASIQYFKDAQATITRSLELLRPTGSVHVLDTILYSNSHQAAEAIARSRTYYASNGAPEMATNYFAHRLKDLEGMGPFTILDRPSHLSRLKERMLGNSVSPFTHLVISK